MYIGSRPRISAAPATAGVTGTSASRTTIATFEARASSFSTDATPPRVASRRQCRPCPAAPSSASAAGHSERVSDSTRGVEVELAAGQHDRRAVVADRARDDDPVARHAAPRATARRGRRSGRCRRSSGTSSRRSRARPPSCRRRRSARRRSRPPSRSPPPRPAGRPAERPSSSTIASVIASGRAPAIARSLTVPLTASSPIEPPGNRIGFTTKLSVVNARTAPPTDSSPASPSTASASDSKAGTSSPSISVCVALPPAPCAIVMRSSRNFGRRPRAVSMRVRTRCSRSSSVRSPGALTRPPARGRSARSCSTRRRRPPARPCTCRSRGPACTRCRTPCTPRA